MMCNLNTLDFFSDRIKKTKRLVKPALLVIIVYLTVQIIPTNLVRPVTTVLHQRNTTPNTHVQQEPSTISQVSNIQYNLLSKICEFFVFYPLANEVAKGYNNTTVRNILVNTLESTSFNGF